LDDVVRPVLRFWRIFERENLDGEAGRARDELAPSSIWWRKRPLTMTSGVKIDWP